MKNSKLGSIAVSILFYIIAIAIAVVSFNHFDNLHLLARIAVADIAATVFIFIGAMLMNNSSMYDPYWSVKPAVIACAYLFLAGTGNLNWMQWLAFVLVQLYMLRLTTNFYRDWVGFSHEDWRYVNFRKQFGKGYWVISFLGIHLFPTVMVYLSCLPLYGIFGQATADYPIVVVIGALVLLASIVLAYIADEQMRTFRNDASNKGKYMAEKLWKNSRHPNYLGEILTWWGLFIMAIGISLDYWWTGIGALAINLMFLFASIPMLDKRSLERRPGFEEYMKKSNALLPFSKK